MFQTLASLPSRVPVDPTSPSAAIASAYSALVVGSVLIAAIADTLGIQYWRRAKLRQTLKELQQRGTLERIFQTHYWSQDYRTQHALEDFRSFGQLP